MMMTSKNEENLKNEEDLKNGRGRQRGPHKRKTESTRIRNVSQQSYHIFCNPVVQLSQSTPDRVSNKDDLKKMKMTS